MHYKKWFILGFVIAFCILLSIALAVQNNTEIQANQTETKTKNKKIYQYTLPERISKTDYFPGEFISNDTASIYPRRDGIVKDILVDIGDEVKIGETLAILLNPGVTGESQSKIHMKNTIIQAKKHMLLETKKVKNAKIAELEQKIKEKSLILDETINYYNIKISQIGDKSFHKSEYGVFLKALENLQVNLQNAEQSKTKLLAESKNNILQKELLLSSKIDEIYNKILPILYIGNENRLDYRDIRNNNLSPYFGGKNSIAKNELIHKLNIFHNHFDHSGLSTKYSVLLEINRLLIKVLQNTIISLDIDEGTISKYISNIHTYQSMLISQKELLDDTKNMHNILEATQKEKLQNIELQISKKQNEISLLSTKSKHLESEKQLAVSKISAEIDTLKKSRELLIANENKIIVGIENEIAIANADLQSEYIQSGDHKIISPFSGIISKRDMQVGEKISPNNEVFRISGAKTSLARITKKEIKFYVPENLKDNLRYEKQIHFYPSDNKTKSFLGSIYRISPEINEKTFRITVQAKVPDHINLPNKSTVRVSLENQQDLLRIPTSTIYNKKDRKIVYYKKDNGKLGIKYITIISDDGEYSLVTGNFDETLPIVTTPIFIK